MANPTCTVSSFLSGTACFNNFTFSERASLWIYYAAQELEALGGTDYRDELGSGGTLQAAAVCFKNLTGNPFVAPSPYYLLIAANNAETAGASPVTSVSDLAIAIECNKNFTEADKAAQMLYLSCELGTHKDYPQ